MWRHPRNRSVICTAVRSTRICKRKVVNETGPPAPPPSRQSGGGLVLKLLGVTTVGVGGTVAYAWYDANFRKKLEQNVPYSQEVLSYVFNALPIEPPVGEVPNLPSKTPPISRTEPDLNKPLGSERLKSVSDDVKQKTLKSEPASGNKTGLTVSTPALPSKHELERRIQDQEAAAELDNVALENLARELIQSCEDKSNTAHKRHLEAVESISMHKEQVKKAMKAASVEGEWDSVARALDYKNNCVDEANRAAAAAKTELDKLSRLLAQGRENANTKTNAVIISAQGKLNKLTYSLDSSNNQRTSAESGSALLSEFRDLVDRGRKQFQKELASIVPDAVPGKTGNRLSEDELNALIGHAHKRIEQLQVRLAEQEALQEERITEALIKQRQEDDQLTARLVQQELQRERGVEQLERVKWESKVYEEMEEKLRQQLSRQAAAHNDHLADVLRVQRRELALQYQDELRESVLQERVQFNNDISDSMARLGGIESAVEARAQMERVGRKAQELWLACQTLCRSLTGDQGLDHVVSVDADVRAVRQAGNEHVFVNTLIDSIPCEAIHQGVHTQTSIVDRFKKVKRVCSRVSMIDETGGSLMKYLLSFLQSLLVVQRSRPLSPDDEVSLQDLDTFTILNQAEVYVNDGDLEQALRLMRQLKGQARLVASDWVKDARVLLETKQAASALLGHASAAGLGSLLSSLSSEEQKCCH